MNKRILVTIAVLVFYVTSGAQDVIAGSYTVNDTRYIPCLYYDELGFVRASERAEAYPVNGRIVGATTPHFLPVMDFTANLLQTVAEQEEEVGTVFLIGPNHGGQGLPCILTDYGWATPFGRIEPDRDSINRIANSGLLIGGMNTDIDEIENDHSLSVITPFIKHYLPETKIVTIMLSRGCNVRELLGLAQIISDIGREKNILLLASIDFSHYLSINETAERDAETDGLIHDMDLQAIKRLDAGHLDAPDALIVLLQYALLNGCEVTLADSVILPESDMVPDIGYSYHVYVLTE